MKVKVPPVEKLVDRYLEINSLESLRKELELLDIVIDLFPKSRVAIAQALEYMLSLDRLEYLEKHQDNEDMDLIGLLMDTYET